VTEHNDIRARAFDEKYNRKGRNPTLPLPDLEEARTPQEIEQHEVAIYHQLQRLTKFLGGIEFGLCDALRARRMNRVTGYRSGPTGDSASTGAYVGWAHGKVPERVAYAYAILAKVRKAGLPVNLDAAPLI